MIASLASAVSAPPRDQRTGVTHALACRSGDAGDETNDRLLHVGLAPDSSVGLVRTADLADHDDRIGLRVVV
jgi:Fe2+ transport system protein FeoA